VGRATIWCSTEDFDGSKMLNHEHHRNGARSPSVHVFLHKCGKVHEYDTVEPETLLGKSRISPGSNMTTPIEVRMSSGGLEDGMGSSLVFPEIGLDSSGVFQ
jgi:hypothetical protein